MRDKLVHGVGVYTKGKYKATENRKHTKVYDAWCSMLQRCYDSKLHERHPTYIGCVVCDEWLCFQDFADWFEANYPKYGDGYCLDKDLKVIGNKVYSPDTCLFTSQSVNLFITDRASKRGGHLTGANWHKLSEKFMSRCRNPFTKKQEHLGVFSSELEAHLAWRKRKSELGRDLAGQQKNHEVKQSLMGWVRALDNGLIHPYK